MAEKRMFTNKILESDAFLELPFSARCLYHALNMNADDDGFLNSPNKNIRITGASQADLDLLIEKRFVLDFGGGIICIKHWRMHNTLKKDRYKPTQYQDQFSKLTIQEDGSYTEKKHNVSDLEPERNHSIDKSSREKNRIVESSEEVGESSEEAPITPPTLSQILDYVQNNNLAVNPNRFFSYYNERNWQTSGGKLIDWIAKIHEWDYEDKQKAEATAKTESKSTGNPFLDLAKEENLI